VLEFGKLNSWKIQKDATGRLDLYATQINRMLNQYIEYLSTDTKPLFTADE